MRKLLIIMMVLIVSSSWAVQFNAPPDPNAREEIREEKCVFPEDIKGRLMDASLEPYDPTAIVRVPHAATTFITVIDTTGTALPITLEEFRDSAFKVEVRDKPGNLMHITPLRPIGSRTFVAFTPQGSPDFISISIIVSDRVTAAENRVVLCMKKRILRHQYEEDKRDNQHSREEKR